jgi:hypothetical protein
MLLGAVVLLARLLQSTTPSTAISLCNIHPQPTGKSETEHFMIHWRYLLLLKLLDNCSTSRSPDTPHASSCRLKRSVGQTGLKDPDHVETNKTPHSICASVDTLLSLFVDSPNLPHSCLASSSTLVYCNTMPRILGLKLLAIGDNWSTTTF